MIRGQEHVVRVVLPVGAHVAAAENGVSAGMGGESRAASALTYLAKPEPSGGGLGRYVPAGHTWQSSAESCCSELSSLSSRYLPSGHTMHPSEPGSAAYLPAPHTEQLG